MTRSDTLIAYHKIYDNLANRDDRILLEKIYQQIQFIWAITIRMERDEVLGDMGKVLRKGLEEI